MTLRRPVVVTGAPCASVVELLEAALSDARAGRLRSVLIAWTEADRTTSHGYAWGEHTNTLLLIGETERAKARLLARIMRDAGDDES